MPRPRVLLRRDGLSRWRSLSGIALPAGGRPAPAAEFGARTAELKQLGAWMDACLDFPFDDGGLYVPAFLHVLTGTPGRPDKYTRLIEREIGRRRPYVSDFDDVVAALDWCWEALTPDVRRGVAARLLDGLQPLSRRDSPLRHFLFQPKLCHAAAAIALED
ncbi:MAG: hypothetical protein V3T70_06860, partial [Phycisphaerae bacterium]